MSVLLFCQDQYMFIHDVLVEYLLGGGQTEVTEDNIPTYVASLTATSNGAVHHDGQAVDHCNMLEKQFKVGCFRLQEFRELEPEWFITT